MNIQQQIKELPKIELHCHIDGSIRPETILDIALKENIQLPTNKIEEFRKLVQVSPNCSSLKEYLEKFALPLKVMQKSEYIRRITLEILEDCANNNVKYIELRFAPFLSMEGGLSFEEVMNSVLDGMREGKEKYGVLSNIILICMRHHPPAKNLEIVEKGKRYLGKGVAAIDIAGNELDFPPELHKEAFKLAKQYGYHITVHAGEVDAARNIITAVKDLYAERIGHGVYAIKDNKILNFLKENKIPLEICVSSNVQTHAVSSLTDHPIKKFFDLGITVTINTDNTTVSNTTLEKEYMLLINEFGFTLEDIQKVVLNGIEASFASEETKAHLKKLLFEN